MSCIINTVLLLLAVERKYRLIDYDSIISQTDQYLRGFEVTAKEFITAYTKSNAYRLTTLLAAFAGQFLTSGHGLIGNVAFFGILVLPLTVYYWRNKPFGITCEYRPVTDNGPHISAEENEYAKLDNGSAEIYLKHKIGSNIEANYTISYDYPDIVSCRLIDRPSDRFEFNDDVWEGLEGGPDTYGVGIELTLNRPSLPPNEIHTFDVLDDRSDSEVISLELVD